MSSSRARRAAEAEPGVVVAFWVDGGFVCPEDCVVCAPAATAAIARAPTHHDFRSFMSSAYRPGGKERRKTVGEAKCFVREASSGRLRAQPRAARRAPH